MKVTVENKMLVSESAKRTLSPMQKEYRKFIKARLKERGVKSPFEGGPDAIIDFFAGVSEEWANHKASLSSESSDLKTGRDAADDIYQRLMKTGIENTPRKDGARILPAYRQALHAMQSLIAAFDWEMEK